MFEQKYKYAAYLIKVLILNRSFKPLSFIDMKYKGFKGDMCIKRSKFVQYYWLRPRFYITTSLNKCLFEIY